MFKKKKNKKTENKKKKENVLFYNPMKVTEALKELGEKYDKKEATLFYIIILLVAFLLGLFLELRWYLIVIVLVAYVICIPKMMFNQKKHTYEFRRFTDVNAYMSQMSQSFISTQNIISSLQETAGTFSAGKMHDTLGQALKIIDEGSADIRAAEEKALSFIEENYNCEKLRNLHHFLLKAEARGGECASEFAILEKTRGVWEDAVAGYHSKIKLDRNMGTLMYFFMIIVCIIAMRIFPEDLSIIDLTITQITNTIILVLFIFYFILLDNRITKSLLQDKKDMTKEKADSYFAYLQGYDAKKERKKYLWMSIIVLIAAVLLVIMNPSAVTVGIGIVLSILGFNINTIIFNLTRMELKAELKRVFPKWLFDIMLLIQSESVEGAIMKSEESAPPALQSEIRRISNTFEVKAHDADAYVSFLADFNIVGVEPAMRKLYSLAVGTGGAQLEVMNVIIESNMDLLVQSEKDSIDMKGSFSEIFQTTPVIIITFGMIMYMVALVNVVLDYVMSMM